MGTTGLTSQAVGANNKDEVAAILSRVLLAGLVAGCVTVASQWFLFRGVLYLSPASSEVEDMAWSYLYIRVLTAPVAIALFSLNGWLIGQERTKEVLTLQLIMNGTNILLDLLFVRAFKWAVKGVATASVIAEVMGFSLGIWICRGTLSGVAVRAWKNVFDRPKLIRMCTISSDIILRTLMLEAIFVSFTFIGARFGNEELAANHVLLQFLMITSFLLDGFAYAVEAYVGQAYGSKNLKAY